jgi:hypothetical protein
MIQIDFKELIDYVTTFDEGSKKKIDFSLGFRDMVKALTKISKVQHRYKNRTGVLSNSLKAVEFPEKKNELSGQITSDTHYASYIYYGTEGRDIKPTKASVLAFKHNGKQYFSKGHWINGIKADNWIEKNFNKSPNRWLEFMVRRAIK